MKIVNIPEKLPKTYFSTSDSLAGSDDGAGSDGSSFANVGTVQDGHTLANQTIIINVASMDNRALFNHDIISNMSMNLIRGAIHVNNDIVTNMRIRSDFNISNITYNP